MENNEIENLLPPSLDEWMDAWTFYLLQAPFENWEKRSKFMNINDQDLDFASRKLEHALTWFHRDHPLYPEFYGLFPIDDRIDIDRFKKFASAEWLRFRTTFSGILSLPNLNLRHEIATTVNSVAAVVQKCNYVDFKHGKAKNLGKVIQDHYKLPYVGNFCDQPCIARGTAFLIANDILLTAAHNLANDQGWICDDDLVYLFDYHNDENGNPPSGDSPVAYTGCRLDYIMKPTDDWMLVRLTPKDEPRRAPLKLRNESDHPRKLRGFYSPGCSQGLPMKLSMVGHYVRRLTDNRFAVNLDMFSGNSGSPVISIMDNVVEGLFIAGFPDLVEGIDPATQQPCVKLRTYKYGDIAKGIGGERCQLIDDELIARINEVLSHHCLPRIQ